MAAQMFGVTTVDLQHRVSRLPLEPLLQIRVCGDMLREDLDGDGAVQAGVASFVDLTHAAFAEGGLDLVRAEGGAGL